MYVSNKLSYNVYTKKDRLGGLNCRLFTFFSRLAQASVQTLYNQFSPPNLFFLVPMIYQINAMPDIHQ